MNTLEVDYNSLSPEDKKIWIKAEMERKRKQFDDHYTKIQREMLTKGGFDFDKLTADQRSVILEPSEGPENYHCDGEITPDQAFRRWKKNLVDVGLSAADIKKAIVLNFGK